MIKKDAILNQLNAEQREAVLYTEGDSLIIAGAGSGKTRVLTSKIAYLLTQGYAPFNILALTFTNKAAREMRDRISDMIGASLANGLWMGTFHSVFARLLRRYAEHLGYTNNYTIYDETDSRTLVRLLIKDMNLDETYYKPKSILSMISAAKNNGRTPRSLLTDPHYYQYLINAKITKMPELYEAYCEHCFRANAMDFDDLLLNMQRLLQNNEELRRECHQHFRFILVDEYQDTNIVQHAIVRMLKGPDTKVCVVGDDAQSIYAFRGAVIDNILNFSGAFPGARSFKLTKNYRSTANIVNLANGLIAKNTKRIKKEVEAVSGEGDKIRLLSSFTANTEAQTVAAQIFKTINTDKVNPEEIAILYRTNAQSRLIEENFRSFGIPYRIFGGLSFYDRKEVKDVMAYLRITINPNDDEAFRRIYNVPARGIGATTFTRLASLADTHQLPLMSIATNPSLLATELKPAPIKRITEFVELINDLRSKNDELDPPEMLTYVLQRTQIPAMYNDKSVESESKLQNIDELINSIREYNDRDEYEDEDPRTLEGFVRKIALYTDKDVNEGKEEVPQVTLMTMHASKGLEYRRVYIVGLEEGLIPSDRNSDLAGIEEERRLLYVAITRAKEHCTLSFARERTLHGQTRFASPSRYLYDLDPALINDNSGILDAGRGGHELPTFDQDEEPPLDPLRPARRRPTTPRPQAPEQQRPKRYTRYIRKTDPDEKSAPELLDDSSPDSEFVKGDTVYHDSFGQGIVQGFSDSFSGTKIHVDFDKGGKKVLIVKYAIMRRQ